MHLLWLDDDEPVDNVWIDCPVGETPAADPDALKYPVAGGLAHHQGGVKQEGRLVVVGHNASDEVRVRCVESRQPSIGLGPERGGGRLEDLGSGILPLLLPFRDFSRLSWMVSEELVHNCTFALILVLCRLVGDVVVLYMQAARVPSWAMFSS